MAWRDKLHIFRFWSQKVLPQVYDDALSYYEVLNKIAAFLNECIEKINELIDEQEAFEDAMNQAWEAFKEDMKDEWKAYKVLMEETWNEFKQYILDNLDDWKDETYQQIITEINNELNTIISNLKDELEEYIDGTRTVVIHVENENDVITADKTYNEIRELVTTGSYFVAVYNEHYYVLDIDSGSSFQFRRITFDAENVTGVNYVRGVSNNFITVSDNNEWDVITRSFPIIPNVQNALAGQILRLNGNKLFTWSDETDELPKIQTGDSGKVLKVNSTETGVEWGVDGTGDTLPSYGVSDADKVLKVNSSGTDIEWATESGGTDNTFIVEFTTHNYAGQAPTYTVSQTYADTLQAIEDGKTVIAIYTVIYPSGQAEGHSKYLLTNYQRSTSNNYIMFSGYSSAERNNTATYTDTEQLIIQLVKFNSDETYVSRSDSMYGVTPYYSAIGKFMKYSALGTFDFADINEVPSNTSQDYGKVLRVNEYGDVEWGYPTISLDFGSWSSLSIPSGWSFTDMSNYLGHDINSVVLKTSDNHVFRCRAVNLGSLVFTHIEPVSGGTSGDIVVRQITVTSSNTIQSIAIRCTGTVE